MMGRPAVRIALLVITSLAIAACAGSGERAGARASVSTAPSSIPGVSARCTAAFSEATSLDPGKLAASEAEVRIRQHVISILWACRTVAELTTAEAALPVLRAWGFDPDPGDVRAFCEASSELTGAPICPAPTPRPTPEPTPPPTPTPPPVWDDAAFQDRSRELCANARPSGLYAVSASVNPLQDPAGRRGVYVLLVEYRDLDGQILPSPKLSRGYVYRIDSHAPTPKFHVRVAAEVELVACLALRAIEQERWGTRSGGTVVCPCTTVNASDAIIWMVGATDGELVGQPWLRHPVEIPPGRTRMILSGQDGPGIRPPEQEDVVADIEAFLGLT